jgi:hypothetical protein
MRPLPSVAIALLLALTARAQQPPAPLTLPDAPRIAFVGNTFVERDWCHGHLETRLILAFPDRPIVFRNLGWSGDTVRGEARAGFGQPQDGFNHLSKHLDEIKPNVVILNYGLSEAFVGPAGLPAFESDLAKLLDTIAAKNAPQVILLSLMAQENLGPPMPDPAKPNENVRLYNQALAKAAGARNHRFVDLYDVPALYAKANPGRHFTDNSIHPTPHGFAFTAEQIATRLGLPAPASADKYEPVRQLTIEKNQLYFHRWRPQNETYIFGFRKKEQGRNAIEIPQFDPLVQAKEAEIEKVKR